MASTSNSTRTMNNDDKDDKFERFDDFTFASSWERFISEIETVCRQWLADGPKNLLVKEAVKVERFTRFYKVKSAFKYGLKSYCMEYYFGTCNGDQVNDWNKALHDVQLSFGVKEFLVIFLQSKNSVAIDAPEASKLLSAVAIALSNCSCLWPAFVPVRDPSRKAYIGIQNMGTIYTRRFESDHIGNQVPIKLMHLEGLYKLFVSKFAYAAVDLSMHHFKVHVKMKITYKTRRYEDDDDEEEEFQGTEGETKKSGYLIGSNGNGVQWDDDCPWSDWYSAEDPVKGFMLVVIWPDMTVVSSVDMAELEKASPREADKWFLYPNISKKFGTIDGKMIGFASQLRLLVEVLEMSLEAEFMEDFVSGLNFQMYGSGIQNTSAIIPPPIVLDRVLKDLFSEAQTDISLPEHKSSRAIKGAPLDSLFAVFCLHALWFGNCNIRAIAVLWVEFVREIRWCWEESQELPRMPAKGTIDLSTCLVNQKLHMLAICIYNKSLQGKGDDGNKHGDSTIHLERNLNKPVEFSAFHAVEGFSDRKGSSGVAGSMMLLKSCKIMHTPITQDPPPMTEDMHEERLQAAEAMDDSFVFSGQLEKDTMASDMSAFKAANPDAVFEDFIRWYSPKDWEDEGSKKVEDTQTDSRDIAQVEWPPRGRVSERMSDHRNSWRKIWNEALPLPAYEQKPLSDPIKEGEKALHYLETVRPHDLLQQMVCVAFRAAADILSLGGLEQMTTKMEQLYSTMASTLKSCDMTRDSHAIEDLQELCVAFERSEKLIILASSLHRKFLQSPHLAEAVFNNYCDYCLNDCANDHKEFDNEQKIESQDRNAVAGLFTPITKQSRRKTSQAGSLLNGQEPTLRELVFSRQDRVSGSHYSAGTPTFYQQDVETYRMYARSGSNDLRVALSIASCD